MNPRNQAVIALILMTAIWGTSFPMMKCLNLQIDQYFDVAIDPSGSAFRSAAAAWIIALRCTLSAALFLILFRGITRRIRWPHVVAGAAIGFFFFVGLMCQVVGLATIPASRSGFLTSLTVVMIPMLATMLHRQVPKPLLLCSCAVAMLGVAILTGLVNIGNGQVMVEGQALSHWTMGDTLTIIGAVFFSGQIMLVDWFGKRHESIAFTPSMFATMAACGWITLAWILYWQPSGDSTMLLTDWVSMGQQPTFWGLIVALAAFPSLLAFTLMNRFQPLISATQAGVIYTLEPVFASTFAMFLPALLSYWCLVDYPNEVFTIELLIGGILVLAANALAIFPSNSGQQDE